VLIQLLEYPSQQLFLEVTAFVEKALANLKAKEDNSESQE
jgi:hypothetical protein